MSILNPIQPSAPRKKKTMASEFCAAEENHFDRLPTELIISIFEKIMDVKCLGVCYSVSKLFAALVLQTHFISVQIYRSRSLSVISSWSPGFLNFLKNFCCIEYVDIQFSRGKPHPISVSQRRPVPLLRWKSDSSSFILVTAKSRIDDITGNPMFEATCESDIEYYYEAFGAPILKHMFHFRHRFIYTKVLLGLFPNLKNIWAVESTEQGSVVWEEDIARGKNEKPLGDFCVKLWSAPLVKLPCSGCAMKDVILISIGEIEACHEKNCFEEEEYRELATTMMKEYPCTETPFMTMAPGVSYETSHVVNLVLALLQSMN